MGPEKTEIRATSAKIFKSILWRPFAIVVIAAASSAGAEAQFTPTPNYLSNRENSINGLLKYPSAPLEIEEVLPLGDREECKQIFGTDYRSENERSYYLENCSTVFETQTAEHVTEWLRAGGWSEPLFGQARAVAYCESSFNPHAENPNGLYKGLFGLSAMWFEYAHEDPNSWSDPVINARVAFAAYNYDLNRGQKPWTQWGCKP